MKSDAAAKTDTAAIPRPTDHGEIKGMGRIDEHAKQLSNHHDRLTIIEKRLGVHGKADDLADQDQAGLVKGDPAKHDKSGKSDKISKMYERKRHA